MVDDTIRYRRLVERYMNGGLDRRRFLGAFGAAGLAYGVVGGPMGFLMREAYAATRLRFDSPGGTVAEAFEKEGFVPFRKRTGINVEAGSYPSTDAFVAKVQASAPGTYHMFFCESEFAIRQYSDLGYATVLDEKRIPNIANVVPVLMERFRTLGEGKITSVPFLYQLGTLSWNTKHVDEAYIAEKGVQALLDPKYKDKIAADINWIRRIWYAALQAGENPNDIKNMSAVWDKVRQSKSVILKYYNTGAEQMDLMAKGEVWIQDTWSGRMIILERQGHPIKTIAPKGTRCYVANLFVMKGSPMDEAYELVNALLEPEVAIAVAKAMGYTCALDPNKVKLPPEITSLVEFDPTGKLEGYAFQDPGYWIRHALEWQKQFQRIVSR